MGAQRVLEGAELLMEVNRAVRNDPAVRKAYREVSEELRMNMSTQWPYQDHEPRTANCSPPAKIKD